MRRPFHANAPRVQWVEVVSIFPVGVSVASIMHSAAMGRQSLQEARFGRTYGRPSRPMPAPYSPEREAYFKALNDQREKAETKAKEDARDAEIEDWFSVWFER